MKICLAQINPLIGDFHLNARKIEEKALEAERQGCDLIVFPELALCGYPPQDLLERESFINDHAAVFAELVNRIQGIGVICGIIERHTGIFGKPLHNSAALFADGKVLFVARKRLLPTYDVFDESRYFEPGEKSEICFFKGLNFAFTICEDIWNDKDVFSRQLYCDNPLAEMIDCAVPDNKIDLVINISASPYHIGKDKIRKRLFAKICENYTLPLVYVNQVGGQDSLLFDGNSLAIDRQGKIISQAGKFREDMVLLDTATWQGDLHPKLLHTETAQIRSAGKGIFVKNLGEDQDDTAEVFAALVMGVRDYVAKCGFKKVILGLSGGIDSALTAVIACEALGPENVTGVAMPSPYSSQEGVYDARVLAETLGCRFEIVSISPVFKSFLNTLSPLFAGLPPDVTEQNIQARIRGNLLMALSNKFGALLLSTGNKSEMAVGYCTLYGDMSGGLAVIADVPKLLVYELARFINRRQETIPTRIISRAPSAELAPNQVDQDDLPPYEVLDPILAAYLEENLGIGAIVKMGFEKRVVEDVVRRIKNNEHKRKQAPVALKVTSKSFGQGRRYPTAQNYNEGLQ